MVKKVSASIEKWIIKKNDNVQINLFFGKDPFAIGHIVIQPESDIHDISETGEKEWKTLCDWIPKVSHAMKKVLREVTGEKVVRIYLCSFNESTEYPVHFHLVPRYDHDTLMGPDLLFFRGKARQMISPAVRDAIVRKMRNKLEHT